MGINTTIHDAQLNWVTGTTHLAAPAGVFLGLYIGSMPTDAGTGGTEATGTRPAITLGSPATDGANGRRYITHAAAVSAIQLTNTNAGQIVGWGIFAAATGGTPNVVGSMPSAFQVAKNGLVTIPAGAIKVYAGAVG
jgi:hypothetical protein